MDHRKKNGHVGTQTCVDLSQQTCYALDHYASQKKKKMHQPQSWATLSFLFVQC